MHSLITKNSKKCQSTSQFLYNPLLEKNFTFFWIRFESIYPRMICANCRFGWSWPCGFWEENKNNEQLSTTTTMIYEAERQVQTMNIHFDNKKLLWELFLKTEILSKLFFFIYTSITLICVKIIFPNRVLFESEVHLMVLVNEKYMKTNRLVFFLTEKRARKRKNNATSSKKFCNESENTTT